MKKVRARSLLLKKNNIVIKGKKNPILTETNKQTNKHTNK